MSVLCESGTVNRVTPIVAQFRHRLVCRTSSSNAMVVDEGNGTVGLLSRSILAASLELRVHMWKPNRDCDGNWDRCSSCSSPPSVRKLNRDWDGNWHRRSSCSTPPSQVNTPSLLPTAMEPDSEWARRGLRDYGCLTTPNRH